MDVTHVLVVIDVSDQPVVLILKGQTSTYEGRRFYHVVIPGLYPEDGRSVFVLTYQTTGCHISEDHSASL